MVFLGIRQIRDPYYQGFAAQLSFYFICSIVPIVIMMSQLLVQLFHLTPMDVVGWLLQVNNETISQNPLFSQIKEILQSSLTASSFTNVVYIFVALWAASGAQFSLMRISNFMYTEGRTTGKGYFRERFRAIITMVIFIVIIVLALLALLYGGQLLQTRFHMDGTVWTVIRWPISFILYVLMISFQYYMMPSDRLSVKNIIPGSIFASVGMVIVSMIYALLFGYRNGSGFSVYGMLTNIIAVMIWFYILAWVLTLGMLFNKVWMDTENGADEAYYIFD